MAPPRFARLPVVSCPVSRNIRRQACGSIMGFFSRPGLVYGNLQRRPNPVLGTGVCTFLR